MTKQIQNAIKMNEAIAKAKRNVARNKRNHPIQFGRSVSDDGFSEVEVRENGERIGHLQKDSDATIYNAWCSCSTLTEKYDIFEESLAEAKERIIELYETQN